MEWCRFKHIYIVSSTVLCMRVAAPSKPAPCQPLTLHPIYPANPANLAPSPPQAGPSSVASASGQCLPPGRLAREEWISAKLGSKLSQQLKDVLAICGGSLPSWCRQLVFSCKFLFPFEVSALKGGLVALRIL